MTITRINLESYLERLLKTSSFSDYCPNGLQVQGREKIKKIAFAVSASIDSIESAANLRVDAFIVHHGVFWHGQQKTLTGPFLKRISPLIKKDINLLAYHLPLDANLKVGNAKSLAQKMGLTNLKPFGNYKGSSMGVYGRFKIPISPFLLKKKLEALLSHSVYLAAPNENPLKTIGIITGGASSKWTFSRDLGLDAYLTGEMHEHDYHESKESGINMFAGGHYATEKWGILSLMDLIEKTFNVEVVYIEQENPA